jgi:hypothetical protein
VAHVAALLRHGVITEHETFDCYEPFDAAGAG